MTIELPTNPDIDQLRRQAKNFCSRLDRATQQRSTGSARQPTPVRRCPLADAQRAPAYQYGYPRWPRLRRGVADARGRIIGTAGSIRPDVAPESALDALGVSR